MLKREAVKIGFLLSPHQNAPEILRESYHKKIQLYDPQTLDMLILHRIQTNQTSFQTLSIDYNRIAV